MRGPFKPDSPAKKWATERNWNKRRLASVRATLVAIQNNLSTMSSEHGHMTRMIWRVDQILRNWKKSNRTSKSQFIRGVR